MRRGFEPYKRIENDSLPQRDALYEKGNNLSLGKKGQGSLVVHYHPNSHVVQLEEVNGAGGPMKITLNEVSNASIFVTETG